VPIATIIAIGLQRNEAICLIEGQFASVAYRSYLPNTSQWLYRLCNDVNKKKQSAK
jgi:hypothetical protein